MFKVFAVLVMIYSPPGEEPRVRTSEPMTYDECIQRQTKALDEAKVLVEKGTKGVFTAGCSIMGVEATPGRDARR
jgi:hypothetical protein